MLGAEVRDVGEGVRVRGVVRVDQEVGRRELGAVLEDGGFEFAELFEDEGALLPARQLDAVDGVAGFDARVVGGGEGPGEEGVQEGRLARSGGAEDVGEEDVAFGLGELFAAVVALARFGQVQR